MTSQAHNARHLGRWPWSALFSLFLALVAALVGLAFMVPSSDVKVDVRGANVTDAQVRASLDGVKAYSPFTVRVCGREAASQCKDPGNKVVTLREEKGRPVAEVGGDWLWFPTFGSDEDRPSTAQEMVSHAVETSSLAGQNAGQASTAAYAAIEAQSLAPHRSPLVWGGLVLICIGTAFLRGYLHLAQRKRQDRLRRLVAQGTKALSAAFLRLETAELTSLQLETVPHREQAAQQDTALAEQLRRCSARAVALGRVQDELETWPADRVFTTAQARRITEFKDRCSALDKDLRRLSDQAALQLNSPNAVRVWDREARPLLESFATMKELINRAGIHDMAVDAGLSALEKIRETVLDLGAHRTEHTPSASTDLEALVSQTLLVDRVLNLMLAKLAWRKPPRKKVDLPRDLRRLSPGQGVRLRSTSDLERRPLVAAALGNRDVMTAQGFRSWWMDAIDLKRARSSGKASRELGKHQDEPDTADVEVPSFSPATVALICVVFSLLVGAVVSPSTASLEKSQRKHSPSVVSSSDLLYLGDGPTTEKDMANRGFLDMYEPVASYVPMKVAFVQLPVDKEQDRAKPLSAYPKGHARDKELDRRLRYWTFPMSRIKPEDQADLARKLVNEVARKYPQLYDPKTGDLRPDTVAVALREVPDTDPLAWPRVYRIAAWAWGPTPATEHDGGQGVTPTADTKAQTMLEQNRRLVRELSLDLSKTYGRPPWITSPATKVAIGVLSAAAMIGVITLLIWLANKPWRALGASGRRRRASDRALARLSAYLLTKYSAEDEDALNALVAAQAERSDAGSQPSVEAERHRVRTRTQALALRRAEELSSLPKNERCSEGFSRRVAELEDAVTWIDSSSMKSEEIAQSYLDSMQDS